MNLDLLHCIRSFFWGFFPCRLTHIDLFQAQGNPTELCKSLKHPVFFIVVIPFTGDYSFVLFMNVVDRLKKQ